MDAKMGLNSLLERRLNVAFNRVINKKKEVNLAKKKYQK